MTGHHPTQASFQCCKPVPGEGPACFYKNISNVFTHYRQTNTQLSLSSLLREQRRRACPWLTAHRLSFSSLVPAFSLATWSCPDARQCLPAAALQLESGCQDPGQSFQPGLEGIQGKHGACCSWSLDQFRCALCCADVRHPPGAQSVTVASFRHPVPHWFAGGRHLNRRGL